METIDKRIKGIVIPSGNTKQDLKRANRALSYSMEKEIKSPYIIAGLGPDTNKALEDHDGNYDFHKDLYNFMINETQEFIGVDINSMNTTQNLIELFPKGVKGSYVVVSEKTHLKKFKILEKYLKKKDLISNEVNIDYVETDETLKEKIYGELAIIATKKWIKGKKPFFLRNLVKKLFG